MVVYRKLPFCTNPQPKQKGRVIGVTSELMVLMQASNVVWMEAHVIPLQAAALSKHHKPLLLFTLILQSTL